jgi:hypothetical protein
VWSTPVEFDVTGQKADDLEEAPCLCGDLAPALGRARNYVGGGSVKKLIVSSCIAAGLLLPAAPASAWPETDRLRVTECPPGYQGYVVQTWNEKRGWYDVLVHCTPYGP